MREDKTTKNLGHKIRIINNNIDKYFHSSWEKAGIELTRMQCATLHYLKSHEKEDVFQKDIEIAFSISGATATNILKIMEKDDFIQRVPMEKDARLKKLEMTQKGTYYHELASEHLNLLEDGMKKGFTEEEITQFYDYLERVAQNIVDLTQ